MATVAFVKLTAREQAVLSAYGRGAGIADIAGQIDGSREQIGQYLIDVCSLNRNRARELVRTGMRRALPSDEPTPPRKRRTRRAATAVESVEEAALVVAAVPEPAVPVRAPTPSGNCPGCNGERGTLDVLDPDRWAECPDCAGSGKAEHSITANEAPVQERAGVCDRCGGRYITPYQAGTITRCCGKPLRQVMHTLVGVA